MGAVYNMNVNQGEDFQLHLLIKDQTGTVIDISTDTFSGQIREKYDASSVVGSFSFENGEDTGSLIVKISNSVTSSFPCRPGTTQERRPITEFIYDIERNSDGIITRILEGSVFVSPNVTR